MKCGYLENGWQYALDTNSCQKSLTIFVIFKAGSINELPEERGLSHFIEHLFFQGTKGKLQNSKDITNAIYQYGGEINASTSYDYTGYYVKIGAQYLEKALQILSEMLFQSKFSPSDLEKEKLIVIQENLKHNSEPRRILHNLTQELVYQQSPLENDIGGYPHVIRNFDQKMIMRYLQEQYEKCVVSIVGHTSHTEKKTIDLLNQYLGKEWLYSGGKSKATGKTKSKSKSKSTAKSTAKNYLRNPLAQLALQRKPRMRSIEHSFQEAYVSVAFPLCQMLKSNSQQTVCDILGVILAGNMSARLYLKLREEKQYVYSVKYYVNHYEIGGDFSIQCGTNPKYVRDVVNGIIEEFVNIKLHGITQEELEEAKNFRIGQLTLELEDSKEMAFFQGYQLLFQGECRSLEKTVSEYQKVTIKDINQMVNQIFDFKKINVAVIDKKK